MHGQRRLSIPVITAAFRYLFRSFLQENKIIENKNNIARLLTIQLPDSPFHENVARYSLFCQKIEAAKFAASILNYLSCLF